MGIIDEYIDEWMGDCVSYDMLKDIDGQIVVDGFLGDKRYVRIVLGCIKKPVKHIIGVAPGGEV